MRASVFKLASRCTWVSYSLLMCGLFSGWVTCHYLPTPAANKIVGCARAKYRGIGTDRSKVAQFKRSGSDVGSTEVQIAQLSARVEQLTTHLQQNRKDYAATRGLNALLGQRRKLMLYLYNTNR